MCINDTVVVMIMIYKAYSSLGLIDSTDESDDNVELQEAIQHSLKHVTSCKS